jgi:polyhydroxyalkanoate synthesis regulator phasin
MTAQTRSPFAEDATAFGEQLRQTAAQATEQARQTISTAQEQFQQSLSQAHQAQRDVAGVLVRLSEQNSKLAGAAFSSFWDASLSMLKVAAWGQEQVERGVRHLIDQGRLTREEGAEIVREATEQARRHQAELVRLAQESLRTSLESFPTTGGGAAPKGEEKPGK